MRLNCSGLLLITLVTACIFSCKRKESERSPVVHIIENEYVCLAVDTVMTDYIGSYDISFPHGGLYYSYFHTMDESGNRERKLFITDRNRSVFHNFRIPYWWESDIDGEKNLPDSLKGLYDGAVFHEGILLEDDKYVVTSVCRGEFGGMVLFRDKSTGIIYGDGATCALSVNKLNGKYYVTNFLGHLGNYTEIIEIDDPSALPDTTTAGIIYRYINSEEGLKDDSRKLPGEFYSIGGKIQLVNFSDGSFDLIYPDNMIFHKFSGHEFEPNFSFVHKGRLLHFYNDEGNCYIGEVVEGEMEGRYLWPHPARPRYYAQFKEGYHFASFSTGRLGEYGFLEVTPDTIHVRYFTNGMDMISQMDVRFVPLGTRHTQKVTSETFEDSFENIDSLTIRNDFRLEQIYQEIISAKEVPDEYQPDVRVKIFLHGGEGMSELCADSMYFTYKGKTYEVHQNLRRSLDNMEHYKKYW